ncbi:hypothetical protein PR202_ga23546 [Eleusine coracana subsp. coracana]|uniref:Wall-associated receptor kinase C-terminal domain-containing protein n=1 Tax=Eleusine coracana subsp. coracana TaxID=191504 RepID=A0AAV5D601_ELECO|nr:hypothetical protein PR202_ga23546 [Eleusine coracana subsp. coracana]
MSPSAEELEAERLKAEAADQEQARRAAQEKARLDATAACRPAGVRAQVQQLRVRRVPEELLLKGPRHRHRLRAGDAACTILFNVSSAFDITDRFKISPSNRELYVLSKCINGMMPPPGAVTVTSCSGNSSSNFVYLGGSYGMGQPPANDGRCELSELLVLGSEAEGATSASYRRLIRGGFRLEWEPVGDCNTCRARGGQQCRYDGNTAAFACLCSDGSLRVSTCDGKHKSKLTLIVFTAAAGGQEGGPCSTVLCGDVSITFPFGIVPEQATKTNCGEIGFQVRCSNDVPYLGYNQRDHWSQILNIFYHNNSLLVVDDHKIQNLKSCRMPTSNSSTKLALPFSISPLNQELIFYNCTEAPPEKVAKKGLVQTRCHNNTFVLAAGHSNDESGSLFVEGCSANIVPVLGESDKVNTSRYEELISGGFLLTWVPPPSVFSA